MSKAHIALDDSILEWKVKINADNDELPNLPL